jgi:hypothetical protein
MDLQIDRDSEVPKLPTMGILPPSAEELQFLETGTSDKKD